MDCYVSSCLGCGSRDEEAPPPRRSPAPALPYLLGWKSVVMRG